MRIGYARVSTTEQNLDLQRDALKRAGCEKIIEDTVSGGKVQRPGLERVHDTLRPGDVLAVWRLDRLGRSLKHLIELMGELEGQGIGFQSVTESFDTTTPGGRLVFHIFDWKDTHRAPSNDDIIDRIRQPRPQCKLLSRGHIDPTADCLGTYARGLALHVLSSRAKVKVGVSVGIIR
jgi:Resolvase, N terminal domain